MKKDWESKLNLYFEENLRLDREAEEIRKELLKSNSPKALFSLIDINSDGLITKRKLIAYLTQLNQSFNYDSLRRVIHWYDKDGDCAFNYNDFSSFILPHSTQEEENANASFNRSHQPNRINNKLFIALMHKEMEISKRLGDIAEDIKASKNFLTYDAFLLIVGDDKYINQWNLKQYLMHQGIRFNSIEEIDHIIYRYAPNSEDNISYEEYKNIFFPYVNERMKLSFDSYQKTTKVYSPHMSFSDSNNEEIKYNDTIKSNNDNSNSNKQPSFHKEKLNFNYSTKKELNTIEYNDNAHNNKSGIILAAYKSSKNEQYNGTMTYDNHHCKDHFPSISSYQNYINQNHQLKSHSLYDMPLNSTINMTTSHDNAFRSFNETQNSHLSHIDIDKEGNKTFFTSSPYKEFSKNKEAQSATEPNKSTIKAREERKKYFIGLISEILKQELLCESIKEEIAKEQSMNLPDIFSYFDYSNRDHISITDLNEVLHDLPVEVSISEIELLLKRYDRDYDRHLDYSEFCMMILHKKIEYARMLSNHQPREDFKGFSNSSLKLLSELFATLIKCEKACEEKKKLMASYPGYSNFEMFEMIKSKYTNIIYRSDLIEFLKKNDIITTPFEQQVLMDYFDKEKNGEINFNAFIKALAPNS